MSCIRFNTPLQRHQLKGMAPALLTAQEAASAHTVPVMTESKLRRLRILAQHPDEKIRQSVASNRNCPPETLLSLAADPADAVRGEVAHNPTVPLGLLRNLAADRSETVRAWSVLNPSLPEEVLSALAIDDARTVRELVKWRRTIRNEAG